MILRPYADADESRARGIYESSFPASLRAPWPEVRDHRADEQLLILDDAGPAGTAPAPVGLALVRHLGDTTLTFVRYLAVDATQRNRGLGSALVTRLLDLLAGQGRSVLLLDVEEPVGEHADDDRRRIEFYRRHGLDVLDVPGYAPPDHGESGEVVPLLLMGITLDGSDRLSGDGLDDCVAAVLLHRYGVPPRTT